MASNRQTCRERLIATTYASVGTVRFGYMPSDLKGASKVICVYSDRSRHTLQTKHQGDDFYIFNVDAFVLRDLETSEDDLDILHEALRGATMTGKSDATWNEIDIDQDSECFFAAVGGKQYRVEQHKVIIKVTQ